MTHLRQHTLREARALPVHRGASIACALLVLLLFAMPLVALGAPRVTSRTATATNWSTAFCVPGPDSLVRAIVAAGDTLVVAGAFDHVGNLDARSIALFDGQAWYSLGEGLGGDVYALTWWDGHLIAGGTFTRGSGSPANYLAMWDGVAWESLGDNLDGPVLATTVFQGDLVVGGDFLHADAESVNGIARWDGSGWHGLGGGVSEDTPEVDCLYAAHDSLYVGGRFVRAGADSARNIARWDGSTWHDVGVGVFGPAISSGGAVRSIAQYQGKLVVAGSFSYVGLQKQYMPVIAYWTGSQWQSLKQGVNGDVFSVLPWKGFLFVGGNFDKAGRQTGFSNIASWDGVTWRPVGSGVRNSGLWLGPTVDAVAAYRDSLAIGGHFDWNGEVPEANLATWNGGFFHTCVSGASPSYDATCMHAWQAKLAIGGAFSWVGSQPASALALWDGTTWSTLGSGSNGALYDLDDFEGSLIAAGDFTTISGVSANRIAAWNGTTWAPLGTGLNGIVSAVQPWNGVLVVAGAFTAAGGAPAAHVAIWTGSAWQSLGSGLDGWVYGLGVWNGLLVATGQFHTAGGIAASGVALWDGATWSACGAGIGGGSSGTPTGYAVATYNGELIIGGDFDAAGGGGAHRLAAWNGVTWREIGGGVGGSFAVGATRVTALTVDGPLLTVGGLFSTAGDSTISYVARWDGTAWHGLGAGVTMHDATQGTVWGLGTWNNALWIAGNMATAGGTPSNYIAAWNEGDLVGVSPPSADGAADRIALRVRGGFGDSPAVVEFRVPSQSRVRVTVLDARGRLVAQLVDSMLAAGSYHHEWRGLGISARVHTVYQVHVTVGDERRATRLLWIP